MLGTRQPRPIQRERTTLKTPAIERPTEEAL
jgi:hypothetical protein